MIGLFLGEIEDLAAKPASSPFFVEVISFVQENKDILQEIKRENQRGMQGFSLGIYSSTNRYG